MPDPRIDNLPVAAVMRTQIPACTLRTPLSEISRRMREEAVQSVVVASSGSDLVAGVVTELDLLRALLDGQAEGMAADVMSTDTPMTAGAAEPLAEVIARMQAEKVEMVIILDGQPERPVGVLTPRDVAAYLARTGVNS